MLDTCYFYMHYEIKAWDLFAELPPPFPTLLYYSLLYPWNSLSFVKVVVFLSELIIFCIIVLSSYVSNHNLTLMQEHFLDIFMLRAE